MAEPSISQLSERVETLEREVKDLRNRAEKDGWRGAVGSASHIPDEIWDDYLNACLSVRETLDEPDS